ALPAHAFFAPLSAGEPAGATTRAVEPHRRSRMAMARGDRSRSDDRLAGFGSHYRAGRGFCSSDIQPKFRKASSLRRESRTRVADTVIRGRAKTTSQTFRPKDFWR